MRAWWTLLFAAALRVPAGAQDPGGAPPVPAAKEPKEPPAWKLPERDARKLEDLFAECLNAPAKDRAEVLRKLEKFLEKPIDGHSALEDVAALVGMANRARVFDPKLKKGQVQERSIGPEVHGFPMGTVKYWLWTPKDYRDDRLWPLLFCLPDNKKHGDGKKYAEEWVAKSSKVAEGFLVVVPQPHAKGAPWTEEESLARAMIALRHAAGTFGVDRNHAGPASDYLRIFLEGEDAASLIAARFPEIFAGAVLRGGDGRAGGTDVSAVGLSGLPAYCVIDPGKRSQVEFAAAIEARNDASVVVEDASVAGDLAAIGEWLDKLPPRQLQPREISYTVHDSSFQRHYWINVLDFDAAMSPAASFDATADRARNEVKVEVRGVSRFELFLNDVIVDLTRPVRIAVVEDEKEMSFFGTKDGFGAVPRDLGTLVGELLDSNHPWRIYPAKLLVDVRQLRERAAAAPPPEAPGEEAKQSTQAAE